VIVFATRKAIRWRPKIARRTRRPRTIFSDVQAQFASTDFVAVKLLNRLSGVLFGCESYECEASRASALPVLWNVNVNHLTDLSEELA